MQSQTRDTGQIAKSMRDDLNSLYIKTLAGSIGVIIILVILLISLALPLAAIIVGSLRINNCPIQSMIPIWLIVVGVVGFIGLGFNVIRNLEIVCKRFFGDEDESYRGNATLGIIIRCVSTIISVFSLAWMIAVSTNRINYFCSIMICVFFSGLCLDF